MQSETASKYAPIASNKVKGKGCTAAAACKRDNMPGTRSEEKSKRASCREAWPRRNINVRKWHDYVVSCFIIKGELCQSRMSRTIGRCEMVMIIIFSFC